MTAHLRAQWRAAVKRPPAKLYHFTSTIHLPVIVAAGYLRPVESNITPMGGGGPDVVWLTDDPDAASHTAWAGGAWKTEVRFTVKVPKAQHWPEFARAHGIEEFWYDALANAGGDPETWWVSPEIIPARDWLEVLAPEGHRLNGAKVASSRRTAAIQERPATPFEKATAIQEGFNAFASKVWEIIEGGQSVAQLWWSPGCVADPGGLTIHALFVDPAHRRQGLGTKLLDHMAERFEGHAVDPGGQTPEGEKLWAAWVSSKDFYEVNGMWWLEEPEDFDD